MGSFSINGRDGTSDHRWPKTHPLKTRRRNSQKSEMGQLSPKELLVSSQMALFIYCSSLLWAWERVLEWKFPTFEAWHCRSLPIPLETTSSPACLCQGSLSLLEVRAWNRCNGFLSPSPVPLHRLATTRERCVKPRSEYVPSLLQVLPECQRNPSALAWPTHLCPLGDFLFSPPPPFLPSPGDIKAWLGN